LVLLISLTTSVRKPTPTMTRAVCYDGRAAMLLNESQKQSAEIRALKQQLAEMHAALVRLQANGEFVAQR
jgi:hypothetical protein